MEAGKGERVEMKKRACKGRGEAREGERVAGAGAQTGSGHEMRAARARKSQSEGRKEREGETWKRARGSKKIK